ncbi:hypothetical protein H0I39_11235 [Ottowia beijingensis]|uniref:Uncharacterized protein n=1 Tax=Ottowia beijingensis TaxID=1207057 RepID=A0A853IYH0_9BURK|nr:hypothetical protein [Ottowia beijingensis]NZA02179.1 hypothetical protein [Ottowia beijingensis]
MFPYRPALCAAVALAAAACTPSLNWREVRLAPTTAVALLPCKPDRAERSVPLGGEPTTLAVSGCEAGGATFALMAAKVPAGRAPDELLAGWQQATLATCASAARRPGSLSIRPRACRWPTPSAWWPRGSRPTAAA